LDFYFGDHYSLYITSIYSFGGGSHHRYKANCKATGMRNCCIKSDCTITFSVDDQFIDPIDLYQSFGFPKWHIITNVGGTPFWFGLSIDKFFTTTKCGIKY